MTIEFLASVLMLVSMIVISMVIQAPLEGIANADKTPNPSKAPWYFLNLQELLLHMHPALAGVIVPSVALGLIAIIPYFDRDNTDVGKWFGTPKALSITWFTTWYTTIWLFAAGAVRRVSASQADDERRWSACTGHRPSLPGRPS